MSRQSIGGKLIDRNMPDKLAVHVTPERLAKQNPPNWIMVDITYWKRRLTRAINGQIKRAAHEARRTK